METRTLTKEQFLNGTYFTTKERSGKKNDKFLYSFVNSRIEEYPIGQLRKTFSNPFYGMCIPSSVTDEGFEVWVELFGEHIERFILFSDLVMVEEP